ncbi:hypothetical protein ACHHYP_14172 [Achlya hypogyna]|uniref:Uncharacterized protein n=1 Tax=Achlya hypogyna TaxID=1202772 RepID=A0A1V9YDZ1_ACHHY|nr:hypothetical protein ACHHYP_14172 [Achlya hypogyna]
MAGCLRPLELEIRPPQYEQIKKTPSTWAKRVAALELSKRRGAAPGEKLRVPRPSTSPPRKPRRQYATEADRAYVAIDASLEEYLQPLDEDGLKKIPMPFLPDMHTLLQQRRRRRNPLEYIKGDHKEVMWLQTSGGNSERLHEYRAWRVAHGQY